jgi:hypothetical protein
LRVEYDDGVPLKHSKRKPLGEWTTRRDRAEGFYLDERRLPIGFMRVSEMQPLKELLEDQWKIYSESSLNQNRTSSSPQPESLRSILRATALGSLSKLSTVLRKFTNFFRTAKQ